MKTLALGLLGLLLVTAACGSNNSSSNGNAAFSAQPQGSFSQAQALPTNDTSRYTTGCATAGQSTSTPQIDSRLQPGMVFDTAIKILSGSTLYTATIENTVVATIPTLMENMKVLAVSGVPGVQPGMSTQATYTLGTDGNFTIAYNPSFPNFQIPNSNCGIDVSSSSAGLLYSGKFTDASGKVFTAQEMVYHATGSLTCNGKASGNGTQDFIGIVSNDIPSEGSPNFCGGVSVFVASRLVKDDGTFIYGLTVERTASGSTRRPFGQ